MCVCVCQYALSALFQDRDFIPQVAAFQRARVELLDGVLAVRVHTGGQHNLAKRDAAEDLLKVVHLRNDRQRRVEAELEREL